MASETTAANPELIQTQVASLLVQPLEAASVVLASGVRIFDTNGPLRIPKLVSGAAVGFVAESAQIPEADVDFGEVSLMPSTLKSLKVLIRFSNELLRQSVIGLDATSRLVWDTVVRPVIGVKDTVMGCPRRDPLTALMSWLDRS
jgi:HK97 family phage major capsid protein